MFLVVACGDPGDEDASDVVEPAVAETLHGELVEMGVGEGLAVCGSSFEYVERFAMQYLVGSADGGIAEPIRYFYVDEDTVHRKDVCGASSRACTRSGVVYAQNPLHLHEMVHALRQLQFGTRGAPGELFFEEGLAQWHSPVAVGWDETFRPADLPHVMDATVPADLYDPAAHLTSVIADDTSFEELEAFVDASAAIEVGEDLEPILSDVLGNDLADLDALYSAQPDCSPGARSRMLVECAAEPLEWAEAPWSSAPYVIQAIGALTCGDPRVIGPLDDRLWVFYAIDVTDAGVYELEVSEPGERLQLTSCDTPCGADVDLQWDEPRRVEIELSPARYVARISRPVGDEGGVDFQLRGPLPD